MSSSSTYLECKRYITDEQLVDSVFDSGYIISQTIQEMIRKIDRRAPHGTIKIVRWHDYPTFCEVIAMSAKWKEPVQ